MKFKTIDDDANHNQFENLQIYVKKECSLDSLMSTILYL